MIRYHSFYPYVLNLLHELLLLMWAYFRWHREGAYMHLMNANDQQALAAVQAFNPYDLYSKSEEPVDPERLKPYYQSLIKKFFPDVIEW
jgi:inositol oxygenase